ncbi:MAG: beta strand repeat-containing protein, partial [Phycisphaerales bacterium]
LNGAGFGTESLTINGNATFTGAVGGTNALDSLTVSGGAAINGGSVMTVGSQSYGDGSTLGASTTLTGDTVTFTGSLDGAASGAQSLTILGDGAFLGNVGSVAALNDLTIAGSTSVGGDVTTAGDQLYGGDLMLVGPAGVRTLTATTVIVGGMVDAAAAGVQGLSVVGDATFADTVGATNALASLAVSGTTLLNGDVSTTNAAGGTGDQTFGDAVTLGADVVLTADGLVSFASTVDGVGAGTETLAINGNAAFGGDVGVTNALGALSVTGTTAMNAATVNTTNAGGGTGAQTYGGAMTLGAAGGLTTLNAVAGDITLNAVDAGAGEGLVVNTSGTTFLLGAIGATGALGTFATDAGGTTMLCAPTLTVTGSVAFGDNVVLTVDSTVSAGDDVSFGGTVDSDGTARALTVNSTGATQFAGAVGATSALSTLTTDAGGTTEFNADVSTTGDQNFNDSVFVNAAGGTITFTSTAGTVGFLAGVDAANGAPAQALNIVGNAAFAGTSGVTNPVDTLSVTGTTLLTAASIRTANGQTFGGAVTLAGNAGDISTLTSDNAGVSFLSTVDSLGDGDGGRGLTVNAPGVTLFTGAVGGTVLLSSLTTDALGSTQINGGVVNTAGLTSFGDNVVLGDNTTITSGGGDINFGGTVTGPFNLAINALNGTTTFNGEVGTDMAPLGSGVGPSIVLDSTGMTIFNAMLTTASGVTVAGPVTFRENATFNAGDTNSTFNGDVTLDGATLNFNHLVTFGDAATDSILLTGDASAITSTATDIVVNSQIDGAQALTIDANAGAVTVNAPIGSVTPLAALTLGGNIINLNAQSIATTGATTFDGAAVLAQALSIDSGGGAITFNSTLDGAFDLTLSAGTGTTTFMGVVGGMTPIGDGVGAAITINSAGLTDFTQRVTTASGIVANGPVTFRDDVSIGDGDTSTVFNGDVTFDRTLLMDADVLTFFAADGVTFGTATVGEQLVQLTGTVSNVGISISTTNTAITFNSRVEGPQDLVVNAGTAESIFNGALGGTVPGSRIGDGIGRALDVTGTGAVTFNGAVRTNSGIRTISATTFAGDVTLGDGDTDSTFDGDVTLAGISFVSADSVTFGNAATDRVTLTTAPSSVTATGANAAVTFSGLLDGAQIFSVTTANSATAPLTFGAAVGSTTPLLRLITSTGVLSGTTGTATLNGNVTTVNGVAFGHNLVLNANSVISANNPAPAVTEGQLLFRGTINSASAMTPRTLTLLTNASLNTPPVTDTAADANNIAIRNYLIPILFGGSIGNTAALQSLNLNFNPSGAVDTLAPGQIPRLATIVFSPRIDANGFVLQPDVTSALLDSTTFNIRIATNGTFVQGFNEKILVFGSLDLRVASTAMNPTGRARIGDITTLRGMSITANTIEVRARPQGFIAGYNPQNQTIFGQDAGIDFVSGSTIDFNGDLIVRTQDGTVASSIRPTFATPDGGGITGTGSFVQRAFGAGDLRDQFLDRAGPGGASATNRLIAFDLQSRGPTIQNVSETIAAFTTVDIPSLPRATAIGGALIDQLKEIAIFVSPLSTEQLIEFLVGRDLYNDAPRYVRVSESDRTVSASRLSFDLVVRVLEQYREIKAQSEAFQTAIGEAYTAFSETPEGAEYSGDAFCKHVRSLPAGSDAMRAFELLGKLFADVDQLGLGPIETQQCKVKICAAFVPDDLTASQLLAAIEACSGAAQQRQNELEPAAQVTMR